MARILVTGAGGFIGRALCPVLAAHGHHVIAGVRRAGVSVAGAETRRLGDILPERVWRGELPGADIVVHLAQRAHRRAAAGGLAGEPAAAAGLARAAAAAGARRFVYLSSIKAMGEETPPSRPFCAATAPRPADAYGSAKLATEQALAAAVAEVPLELVILRPPLVYGPGAGGNFRALARLAGAGLPLPFAAVDNRRSLLGLDNLVDLVAVVASHPAAPGTWLARDDADWSTPELVRLLACGQGRAARLYPIPDRVFALFRALPVVGPATARLTRSLQIDDAPTRAALGWRPPVASEAGLFAAARAMATR